MNAKKQKNPFVILSAVIASLAFAPLASAATFPFLNPGVTPPQDVIAANLDEITPQNTVTVVHTVPQTTASTTVEQYANPSSASFGLVSAIKDPNMSQKVPDCAPPPVPQPSCACGGYAGTVSWSGWDKVSGGTCNGGSAGGWLTTQGGCYACPPPPAQPALAVGSTYTTPYGNTITNNGNGSCTVNGAAATCSVSSTGVLTVSIGSVTDTLSASGGNINYTGVNTANNGVVGKVVDYATNGGTLVTTGNNGGSGGTAGVTQAITDAESTQVSSTAAANGFSGAALGWPTS